jgi:bifunctional non-homologous end joining protein LigD
MHPRDGRRAKKSPATGRTPPALSSPGKILFPGDGYTKQEVWDYYAAVMEHLLPEVADRPLSIIRCPSGTAKPCFFQKHHTAGLELVDPVRLKEESGINAHYLVVRDAASLLELGSSTRWSSTLGQPRRSARQGRPGGVRSGSGPDVPFAEVKKAATDIRKLLAQLQLESFLRVSGGKGLHVVVPLNPGCDWDLTKRFAKVSPMRWRNPSPAIPGNGTKSLRNKRIFVDYLRNGRGATAVASYSLRARPGHRSCRSPGAIRRNSSAQTRSRSRTCQQS